MKFELATLIFLTIVEIVIIGKENGPTPKARCKEFMESTTHEYIVEDLTNELNRRTMEAT
jgi:hypothetical protein